MPTHHLPAEMLIDYASGALREAPALLVATHLALCPTCRGEVKECEVVGGCLLEQVESVDVSESCRAKVLASLDTPAQEVAADHAPDSLCRILPSPLKGYVGCTSQHIAWGEPNSPLSLFTLPTPCCGGSAQLVKIKPGTTLPKHTHQDYELTLVLAGALRDGDKLYRRGDVMVIDSKSPHAPKSAGGEDCLCLMVTPHPICFKGLRTKLGGWLRKIGLSL